LSPASALSSVDRVAEACHPRPGGLWLRRRRESAHWTQLKELCGAYLAGDAHVTAHATDPHHYDERQRAALAWAEAIAWDSDRADDVLWRHLHRAFSEPELVELGYSIAIVLGQQHWLATLGVTEHP
jgi:alkylhydroperoxidase family enzyme